MFVSTDDERVGVSTETLSTNPVAWARELTLKCIGLVRDPRTRGDGHIGTFTGEILADISPIRALDLWSNDGKIRETICADDLWDTAAPLYNIRKRGDVTVRVRLIWEQNTPVFCMKHEIRGFTIHTRLQTRLRPPWTGSTRPDTRDEFRSEPLAETMYEAMDQAMRIKQFEQWEHVAILDNLYSYIVSSQYDLMIVEISS